MANVKFILASASPRRKELLEQAGACFEIKIADIDETPKTGERPEDYVRRLALEKARSIKSDLPVLGADTVVSLANKLFGKPSNEEDALKMLKELNGKTHLVHTGVAIVSSSFEEAIVTETAVTFIQVEDEELKIYVSSREPLDKAGAYGIQGKGSFLVESIMGSYSGVVGLPVSQTLQLLKKYGAWSLNK